MSVLVVGLSHRSSPVALLERAALDEGSCRTLLAELVAADSVDEAVVVATCNRLEVYVEANQEAVAPVTELLSWHTGIPLAELLEHLYVHHDDRAVQHVFSVACGLDSMVVGEGQILGQLRDAIKLARSAETLGRSLGDVGERALRVGKRAHTETHLDRAGADMVTAGLRLASSGIEQSEHGPVGNRADAETCATRSTDLADTAQLAGRRVLVIGAGSLSALAANTAARAGAGALLIANRTFSRADRVAECLTEAYAHIETRAVALDQIAVELASVDLVISCTGAQGTVLSQHVVASAVANRDGRELTLLDLALPHDVDPEVRELSGVHLVNLGDLQRASRDSPDTAGSGASATQPEVQAIMAEEVAEYRSVRRAELVTPTVVALRARASDVVAAEVERLHGRLPELDDAASAEVAYALRRVADKLLHQPTVRVKQLASAPDGDNYEFALRELFDLPATGRGQG